MKCQATRVLPILILVCLLAACAPPPAPVVITVIVQATPAAASRPTPGTKVTPEVSPTAPVVTPQEVSATNTSAPALPSPTSGPLCTIKQDVNVRKGPGKVYGNPIEAFVAGTVVIPQRYVANGFPGGNWVQVMNPGTQRVGWVSAGSDYVSCTIDLSSLPEGDIPPTPKPVAPALSNSQPGGSFDDNWHAKLHLSGTYLVRFEVNYKGQKDGDNIQSVEFTIQSSDGSQTLWQHKEGKAPYCIYGGDPGCAAWPKAGGALIWDPNNPASLVTSGDYAMTIIVDGTEPDTKDPVEATWTYKRLTVKLP